MLYDQEPVQPQDSCEKKAQKVKNLSYHTVLCVGVNYDYMYMNQSGCEEKLKGWFAHLYCPEKVLPPSKEEVYFYHPDHLGSSSWITDRDGMPMQHLAYLPFGEEFVDQRTSDWNAMYKFSGKEKDQETGYNYFGARYYWSEGGIWLSVDPLSDKYPSVSAYCYTLNNPIRLIDPDGREVFIKGDAEAETFKELQSSTKLKLTMDADGKLDATGKIRKKDKLLYEAIKSEDVKVEITANNTNRFEDDGETYATEIGGAFMGNCLNWGEDGNAESAETKQFISMDRVKTCFKPKDVGKLIKHEVTESYMGGRISINRNEPATPAYAPKGGEISPNTIFQDAHKAATPQPINKPLHLLPKP